MKALQFNAPITALTATLVLVSFAAAQTMTTLHAFAGGYRDGGYPAAGLTAGPNGVLYGTTSRGGAFGLGTVYQLTPPAPGGSWTETVLYSFAGPSGGDGSEPYSGLVAGDDGSLYGTTEQGGTETACGTFRCGGTAFKLSPPQAPGGTWTETVLHSFPDGEGDGAQPFGGLVIGANGVLYGTTQFGGIQPAPQNYGYGIVFALTPPGAPPGAWTETIPYSFDGANGDGYQPTSSLVFGANGELYGTTPYGGSAAWGTVFELTQGTGGTWFETILHNFAGQAAVASAPSSPLLVGKNGVLYGTTGSEASAYCTVFALKPPAAPDGVWTEKLLYKFTSQHNGFAPNGVVFGPNGSLYGTAYEGGASGRGVVYQLEPASGGAWTETVLYGFDVSDGVGPNGGLVVGSGGEIYGTTYKDKGTAFQLVP